MEAKTTRQKGAGTARNGGSGRDGAGALVDQLVVGAIGERGFVGDQLL